MTRRINWKSLFLLAACPLAFACAVLPIARSQARIKELDNRFHVLSFNVSHGTNHTVWTGNQLKGEMCKRLRQWGFSIRGPFRHEIQTELDVCMILVTYTGRFPPRELLDVSAELVDPTGKATALISPGAGRYGMDNLYVKGWIVPASLINGGFSYELRISINADKELALINTDKLQ